MLIHGLYVHTRNCEISASLEMFSSKGSYPKYTKFEA